LPGHPAEAGNSIRPFGFLAAKTVAESNILAPSLTRPSDSLSLRPGSPAHCAEPGNTGLHKVPVHSPMFLLD